MKRCPQCNSVFEDAQVYCTEDGAELVDENFALPSESLPNDEEITVIHHEPIKIEIQNPSEKTTEQLNYQIPALDNVAPIVIVEEKRNTGKYLLFLFFGIFLGGVLVVGIAALIIFQAYPSTSKKPDVNVQISSGKHSEPNKTRKDSEFNGFVLSENANIRSAPTGDSLDILPKNDRLSILERDAVWYRIICEHGVTGWMHGNTIRFNDDADPF